MTRRRMTAHHLPQHMYEYRGKKAITYYMVTAGGRVNLGHDLLAAKRKMLDIEAGRPILTGTTVGQLLDDYVDTIATLVDRGKRSARTLSDRRIEVENLKLAFGKMMPGAVTPFHVWEYLHKYRGAVAPVRANREITLLQSAFAWMREQGIVRDNPCVDVTKNVETPRDRLVTDAELRDFCKMAWRKSDAGKRVALAAGIAYLTGKAQGQILKLTRSQLTKEGIEFGKRKGGNATTVRWSKRLRRYVERAIAMPSTITPIYVVHNREGSPYTSQGFKTFWQRLMGEWVALGHERFTFHDLRAKAVSDVKAKGRLASDLTGHRSEATPARVYDRRLVRKADAVR